MNQTIRRVTLIPVRVPVPREIINCPEFAHEPLNRGPTGGWDGPYFADVPFFVVKVEGSGGPVGWGDSSRLARQGVLERYAKVLVGLGPGELNPRVSPVRDWPGRGLMSAALDWRARVEGVPFHSLLGPRVREGVEVADWSGHRTPAGAAGFALESKRRGVMSLKLKAGMEIDAAGIARAVREACGDDFHLVIDPNGRWDTLQRTMEFSRAIVAVNPNVALEDPVYGDPAMEVLAAVRKATGIGTILTAQFMWRLRKAVELDAVSGFNITGNWAQVFKLSDAAGEAKVPFWCGSSVESGLADIATIQFGLTQEMFRIPCELAGHMSREHSLLSKPINHRGGLALPFDGPGLGVDGDEDAIERYRVGDPIVVE